MMEKGPWHVKFVTAGFTVDVKIFQILSTGMTLRVIRQVNNYTGTAASVKEAVRSWDVSNHEKDIGVIVDTNLLFDKHISEIINVANKIMGIIRHTYTFLDE